MWLKFATHRLYRKYARITLSRAYWIDPSGQIIPVQEHGLWIAANLNDLKMKYPDLEEFDQKVKEYESKDKQLRLSDDFSSEETKKLYEEYRQYAAGYVSFLLNKGWIRITKGQREFIFEMNMPMSEAKPKIQRFVEEMSMSLQMTIERMSKFFSVFIDNSMSSRTQQFSIEDFM